MGGSGVFGPASRQARRAEDASLSDSYVPRLRRARFFSRGIGRQRLFLTALSIRSPMSLSMLRQYSNARCNTGSVTPSLR